MLITIAERLKPFSHLPGASFLLPGTPFGLQIFPSKIIIEDLSKQSCKKLTEISLSIPGPVENFTVLQDLEKGKITVWGNSAKGYFRYSIHPLFSEKGIKLSCERAFEGKILFSCEGEWKTHSTFIEQNQSVFIGSELIQVDEGLDFKKYNERLSLGNHKSQDWELIQRRKDFKEIFPIWYRLGKLVAVSQPCPSKFLEPVYQAISANYPESILKSFQSVFLTFFKSGLYPQLCDTTYQGIFNEIEENQVTPIELLIEGAELIRSLLIKEEASTIKLLNALPPQFSCGRLVNAVVGNKGQLSMEWTKKLLRQMTFISHEPQTLSFFFCQHERKCRLRHSTKDRGVVYQNGSSIEVVPGLNYWFDNFEK